MVWTQQLLDTENELSHLFLAGDSIPQIEAWKNRSSCWVSISWTQVHNYKTVLKRYEIISNAEKNAKYKVEE